MAIRLTNMTIWQRDWYLNLDGKYQLFVHYLRDHCDHAGVWQPAFKMFEKITGFRINQEEFLQTVNSESVRVHVLENGKWWLTGFIEDQYRTTEINDVSNPHKGVIKSIEFNEIPYKSYGYNLTLRNPSGTVKDKDKDNSFLGFNFLRKGSGENKDYLEFKNRFPKNGSAINPDVESWFRLREAEGFKDFEKVLQAAADYATYWKTLEPATYPNCSRMKQAINWLREAQYEMNWIAKLEAEKQRQKQFASLSKPTGGVPIKISARPY